MPPKPFKPPRPSTNIKKTSTKSIGKKTSATRKVSTSKFKPGSKTTASTFRSAATSLPSLSPDPPTQSPQISDPDGSQDLSEPELREPEEEEDGDEDARRAIIPPDLLTRLLHEFFKKDGTRISKSANAAVGRYMETFVREALARAAFAKVDGEEGLGMDIAMGGDGFLEVEDLEKLAPQLILDF